MGIQVENGVVAPGISIPPIRLPRHPPFKIVVDTREKRPFEFSSGTFTVTRTLDTGDYSVDGLERYIRIERKSFDDLWNCIGTRREDFKKQLDRLRCYPLHGLLVETNKNSILLGNPRSKLPGDQALLFLLDLTSKYAIVPLFCGTHGAQVCQMLLARWAQRMWEAIETLKMEGGAKYV